MTDRHKFKSPDVRLLNLYRSWSGTCFLLLFQVLAGSGHGGDFTVACANRDKWQSEEDRRPFQGYECEGRQTDAITIEMVETRSRSSGRQASTVRRERSACERAHSSQLHRKRLGRALVRQPRQAGLAGLQAYRYRARGNFLGQSDRERIILYSFLPSRNLRYPRNPFRWRL